MTEQTAPIPWRDLRLVRGGTKGGTAAPGTDPVPPGTEGGTGDVVPLPVPPAAPGTVSVLSAAERAQLTARHWGSLAADGAGHLWLQPDRVGHVVWHGKPASIREQVAYVKSRAWVPPELDGNTGRLVIAGGIAFHVLIGIPLKAFAEAVSAAAERPLRLILSAVAVLLLILIVLPHIHI